MKKLIYLLSIITMFLGISVSSDVSQAQSVPCNSGFVRSGNSNVCFNTNNFPLSNPLVISTSSCTLLDLNARFATFSGSVIIPANTKTVTLLVAPVLSGSSSTQGTSSGLWRYFSDSNCQTVLSGSTISGFKGLTVTEPLGSAFGYRAYFEDTIFINGQTAIYVKSLNNPVQDGTSSIYFSGLIGYTDN